MALDPRLDLTVAIPTYNGSERLPLVLERLKSQVNTEHFAWEILVVDNNSSDQTAQVVQEYQANWPQSYPLRYCVEPQQGAAFARHRAVEQAQGEWVGFLDDDNVPDFDWVSAAYRFSQKYPQAGAFGSKIKAVFEVEPPQELKPILFYLAIVDRGSQPLIYDPRKKGVPPSAGLVVRRAAWLAHVPKKQLLIGRVGQSMLAGEDAEALLYLHRGGWEIWYNPEMVIQHLISASRLEGQYFLGLIRGVGLCRHHLRMLALKSWQQPFAFCLYLLKDSFQLLAHVIRHQGRFQDNILVQCERERLMTTAISPFYLWYLRINRLIQGKTYATNHFRDHSRP